MPFLTLSFNQTQPKRRHPAITRGVYTAASGMLAEENAQQIIAQNLANASTTGYKADVPHFASFSENLVASVNLQGVDPGAVGSLGSGASMDGAFPDFTDGSLQHTENPLDIALRGNAFLTVQTAQGVRYSRDGGLCLTNQGFLAQVGTGALLLSDQGRPIQIPKGAKMTTIQADGTVLIDGRASGKIGLVAFTPANKPERIGDNLWDAQQPQAVTAGGANGVSVEDGFLEASNVNIVKEMVTMITCVRAYEANQKALQTHDELQNHAVNDVGKVN